MIVQRACLALGGLLLHSATATNTDVEALLQGSLQLTETDEGETKNPFDDHPPTGTVWAPVKYNWKEPVEAKSSGGAWIKCKVEGAGVYFGYFHLRCAPSGTFDDETVPPAQARDTFLPNVPYQLIRRVLNENDKDFVLMNSGNWPGKGIKYRYSKKWEDAGGEIAPWGQVVVGEIVDENWIKTDRGYFLPRKVDDEDVLQEQARTDGAYGVGEMGNSTFMAYMRNKEKEVSDHMFEVGEHALYKTKRGEWIKCRIAGKENHGLYAIIAMPIEYAMYPVGGVFPDHLKKIEQVEHHVASVNESKLCQKSGCISVMANTSSVMSNRAFLVQVPKQGNLRLLMTMVCQKVMKEFKTCVNETQFRFKDQLLDPTTRTEESGLDDQSVIQVKTAAEVQAERDRATELERQRQKRQEAKIQLDSLRKAAAKHPNNRNVQEAVARAQKGSKAAKLLTVGKKPRHGPPKKPAQAPQKKPAQAPQKKPAQVPPKKPAQVPPKKPAQMPPKKPAVKPSA
jgi:hypothetical protein